MIEDNGNKTNDGEVGKPMETKDANEVLTNRQGHPIYDNQSSGNRLAIRAWRAHRFDSERRRHGDIARFVLYSRRGRALRRAKNHSAENGF